MHRVIINDDHWWRNQLIIIVIVVKEDNNHDTSPLFTPLSLVINWLIIQYSSLWSHLLLGFWDFAFWPPSVSNAFLFDLCPISVPNSRAALVMNLHKFPPLLTWIVPELGSSALPWIRTKRNRRKCPLCPAPPFFYPLTQQEAFETN